MMFWGVLAKAHFMYNSERNIIIFIMLIEQLKLILAPLNIHFDLGLLSQFLQIYAKNKPNHIRPAHSHIYLYALAAVICENQRLPSVTNHHLVKTGLSIQNIFQHIPQREKEGFLKCLQQVCALEQFRDVLQLKNKIKEVLRAYAIYKKYQKSFELLSQQANTDISLYKKHMSIFWVMYLYAKQQCKQIKQIKQNQQLQIIISLLKYIFIDIIPHDHPNRVQHILKLHFQDAPAISQAKYHLYISKFNSILKNQYQYRYDIDQTFNMGVFLRKNMHFIDRFLDDLTNHYQVKYNNIQNQLVDEVTFLEIDKTLTPQGFKKDICIELINKSLNFEEDDSIDMDSNNKTQRQEIINNDPFSKNNNYNFQTRLHDSQNNLVQDHLIQKGQYPIINLIQDTNEGLMQHNDRLLHLEWINNRIKQVTFEQECVVYKMFQNFTDFSMEEYKKISQKKLLNLLEKYVPSCLDKVKRAKNIMKLFIYFINKVQVTLHHETYDIFVNKESFDAFLFITTIIFNFSYKSTEIDYSSYCSLFNISKISGFIPINWLGYHGDLPNKVKKYLFELEQTILFSQLWKDQSAIQIMSSKSSASYRYYSMKKRLLLHVNAKIYQTCNNLISHKDKSKISAFFEELFQKKIEIFYHNNIDIILSCSIYYCFGEIVPFSTIISENHRLDYHNLMAYDNQNTKISFYDYYKLIFLKEAESLQLNSPKKHSIFCTPKTIVSELSQKKKKDYQFELRNISLTFGNLTGLPTNGTYRQRLRDQYIQSEIKEVMTNQDGF